LVDAVFYQCEVLSALATRLKLNVPDAPEHPGHHWVFDAADALIPREEWEDPVEEDDIERTMRRAGAIEWGDVAIIPSRK
jgi:hypothetical protein